eukprot:m.190935 g.190935  ORF g.190935 m.190935 type:complete len:1322 (+) comp14831_c1_seq2:1857-5822(+)
MITMTFNPKWPEFVRALEEGRPPGSEGRLNQLSRPDLVARIFNKRMHALLDDVKSGKIFGPVDHYTAVIEFQKRGYPHVHATFRFKYNPECYGKVPDMIWAHIPDADAIPTNNARNRKHKRGMEILREKVLSHMIHTPCDMPHLRKPMCMSAAKRGHAPVCSKRYPQPFRQTHELKHISGRAMYCRPSPENGGCTAIKQFRSSDGQMVDVVIDNRYVVPYNPLLLVKYDCHMCVDWVTSESAVRYLYKYLNKAEDQLQMSVHAEQTGEANQTVVNEIEQMQAARYISAQEAVWWALGYHKHFRDPSVVVLDVHSEKDGPNVVVLAGTAVPTAAVAHSAGKVSTLMMYFCRTQLDFAQNPQFDEDEIRGMGYVPFFEQHDMLAKTDTSSRHVQSWTYVCRCQDRDIYIKKRPKKRRPVARIHHVSFAGNSELWHLRLLLLNVPCTSFSELLGGEGHGERKSPQQRCLELGLVVDHSEYKLAIEQELECGTPYDARVLFLFIVRNCNVTAPALFNDVHEYLADPVQNNDNIVDSQVETLQKLYTLMVSYNMDYDRLGLPPLEDMSFLLDQHLDEVEVTLRDFPQAEAQEAYERDISKLSVEQRAVFDKVTAAAELDVSARQRAAIFCLQARAGTGKTFTLCCIMNWLRSKGLIVLPCATSGIAASLMRGGRTAHSLFKLTVSKSNEPMPSHEEMPYCIGSRSARARLLARARVIIIDEVSMLHREYVEFIDQQLRLLDGLNPGLAFGGIPVVMCGDFRQTSPVVPRGGPQDVIDASPIMATCFRAGLVELLQLTQSQRQADDIEFAHFLNNLGDRTLPNDDEMRESLLHGSRAVTPRYTDVVKVPDRVKGVHSMAQLVEHTFGDAISTGQFDGRCAILAPTNDAVDRINGFVLDRLPGNLIALKAHHTFDDQQAGINEYPPEVMDKVNVPKAPPAVLKCKVGATVMFVRNVDFAQGMVNGQKGRLDGVFREGNMSYKLRVTLLHDGVEGRTVSVPRIDFKIDGTGGIEFTRKQFPIRLAFATTIHKSQGQTMSKVGLFFVDQHQHHGATYVAFSRVRKCEDIALYVSTHYKRHTSESCSLFVNNTVYTDLLGITVPSPLQQQQQQQSHPSSQQGALAQPQSPSPLLNSGIQSSSVPSTPNLNASHAQTQLTQMITPTLSQVTPISPSLFHLSHAQPSSRSTASPSDHSASTVQHSLLLSPPIPSYDSPLSPSFPQSMASYAALNLPLATPLRSQHSSNPSQVSTPHSSHRAAHAVTCMPQLDLQLSPASWHPSPLLSYQSPPSSPLPMNPFAARNQPPSATPLHNQPTLNPSQDAHFSLHLPS